jgi:hypothetical protein
MSPTRIRLLDQIGLRWIDLYKEEGAEVTVRIGPREPALTEISRDGSAGLTNASPVQPGASTVGHGQAWDCEQNGYRSGQQSATSKHVLIPG